MRPALPGQTPSAPIAIDPRREANKLRAQVRVGVAGCLPLATSRQLAAAAPPRAIAIHPLSCSLPPQLTMQPKQSSPYGTPTGKKSPLSSPLIK